MPAPLEWTEENLKTVMESIYAQAATDKTFYDKLLASPYEVLSQMIVVPEEYRQKVFVNFKDTRRIVINLPPHDVMRANEPAAASTDYEILCTTIPPW